MSILIGLYDDLTAAQRVISDLENQRFSKSDMHLATYDQRAQRSDSGGFFNNLSHLFDSGPERVGDNRQAMLDALTGWGVSEGEAQNYVEAMRQGSTLVLVHSPDSRDQQAKQIMDRYGAADLDRRAGQGQSGDYAREDFAREDMTNEGETHIPVVEEEMRVGKREVQRGGVRVFRTVHEQPIEETHTVRDETVNVERRPADRLASEADLNAAFQDQTFDVTETDEELVTDKRARVTGDVVVSKQVEEHPETVRDTVRRTEVHTEDLGKTGSREFSSYDGDFRNNYDMFYAKRGHDYSYYEPGYRYGYDLAGMDNYRGKRWSEIEPYARRDFERRYPQSKWDEFRNAIRFGWERASGTTTDTGPDTGTGFTGTDTGEGYGTGMGTNR